MSSSSHLHPEAAGAPIPMNLYLAEGSPPSQAMLWLQQLVRDFGLGFHLDSAPEDYVQLNGQPVFTRDQSTVLMKSLERLFQILGDERPYEIGADISGALLAESRGLKPPLEYQDRAFQRQLLERGTRDELIAWLCWNDPDGIYTDRDSLLEDRPQLTLAEARQLLRRQLERDQVR